MTMNKTRFNLEKTIPMPAGCDIFAPSAERGRERIREALHMSEQTRRFFRKYGVALIAILLLGLWTWVVSAIATYNATAETTERLSVEYEARYRQQLQAWTEEQTAQRLLTGSASLEARMSEEADALAKLLYGYRNNSKRDRVTLVWCVLARVDNSSYPGSVEGVVDQAQQWMFYENNNPIREEDRELALEQLRIWHEGRYPSGLTSEFVFAEWSQTSIRLFDNFEDRNVREYWRATE